MDDARVAELVREAAAAPSMHNAQPWRFRYARGSRTFRLYADFERVMPHSDPDARALHLGWIQELAEEAEARNLTNSGSEEDLARWTRIGIAEADTATDGVPDYAFGPRKHGGRAPMRDFSGGRPTADLGSAPFENDPHLALLSTDGDRPRDWLIAGQAMERVLLLATLEGLATSFSTQVLEWPDLRWPLRDPASGTGRVQMMLRLGYGPKGPKAPRRPVKDVLVTEDQPVGALGNVGPHG